MANTKFYNSYGNIILENVYTDGDKLSINPTNFDWKIDANGNYSARDGIENQEYKLGLFSDIEDETGNTYASGAIFESVLNTSANVTIAGGTESTINEVNQIVSTDRNTELLQEILMGINLTNKILNKIYNPK